MNIDPPPANGQTALTSALITKDPLRPERLRLSSDRRGGPRIEAHAAAWIADHQGGPGLASLFVEDPMHREKARCAMPSACAGLGSRDAPANDGVGSMVERMAAPAVYEHPYTFHRHPAWPSCVCWVEPPGVARRPPRVERLARIGAPVERPR